MVSAESGGPVEQINYFPQNPTYNQRGNPGTWRKMEEYLQKLKESNLGDTFKLEIVPVFEGTKRPIRFRVQISKNGNPLNINSIDVSGKKYNFELIDNPLN